MPTFSRRSVLRPVMIASAFMIAACAPKYDWREVHGTAEPFAVLMPGKPETYSRPINLDGMQVTMTMTAAEIDAVTFAVGSAGLPDAGKAAAAIDAMKAAMVRNIGGTIRSEKSSAVARSSGSAGNQRISIDIEAVGAPAGNTGGQSRLLIARFVASGKRVYQAIVVGREKAVSRDAVEMFFTSFKPD